MRVSCLRLVCVVSSAGGVLCFVVCWKVCYSVVVVIVVKLLCDTIIVCFLLILKLYIFKVHLFELMLDLQVQMKMM